MKFAVLPNVLENVVKVLATPADINCRSDFHELVDPERAIHFCLVTEVVHHSVERIVGLGETSTFQTATL